VIHKIGEKFKFTVKLERSNLNIQFKLEVLKTKHSELGFYTYLIFEKNLFLFVNIMGSLDSSSNLGGRV